MIDKSRENSCAECGKSSSQWAEGETYSARVGAVRAPMPVGARVVGHELHGWLCPTCASKYPNDDARDGALRRLFATLQSLNAKQ